MKIFVKAKARARKEFVKKVDKKIFSPKLKFLKYFLFSLVFIYTFSWVLIRLFASSLGQEKPPITIIQDEKIEQLIQEKTGIKIETIKISESDHPFGMMIGIPTQPQLILSRGLWETFTPDELAYVVLHEAGHYKLYHGLIEFVAAVLLFILGIFVLKKIPSIKLSIPAAFILGLFLGILMVRLGHTHELQADSYTVSRMTNPQGMIEATKKFQNYPGQKYTQSSNKIIQFLFYRGNPYNNRISMAKEEIEKR